MVKKLALVCVWFFLHPAIAYAASMEEMEKRIEALEADAEIYREEAQEEADSHRTPVRISGYVDAEYSVDSRDSVDNGFRLHHLSLFFKKQLAEKWRFFSEIEYEDAPKFEGEGKAQTPPAEGEVIDTAQGKIFVEAVNIDYLWNPKANFRIGRFFTPAGIWSIDHYPPFVPTQIRPEHIRKIFPQVVDGVAAFGTFALGSSFLNYDLYVGNGEGNTGKKDQNSSKAVGTRAYFLFPILDHFRVGASAYTDTLNNGDDKTSVGMDMKIRAGIFTFQAEAADAEFKPVSTPTYNRTGYYGQFLFRPTDHWSFGYRYDFYDANDSTVSELTTNSLFINYHINTDIKLKAEFHDRQDKDPSKEDYNLSILSIVYYLGD